jgi:hypothetical protein
MPSTSNYNHEDSGIFALFKGDSGAGKSTAALSFPRPYVMDHDRKMPNIALKHFPGKDVSWDTFDDIFQVSEKIEELFINCPYETVIADSVTNLIITTLNSVGQIKNEKTMDLLKKLQKTSGGKSQIELMGIDYYNAETRFIEQYWLDRLKSLWAKPGNPKNIIVVAHVITSESAPALGTGLITRTRGIVTAGRKVGAYIPTVFDDAYHFGYEQDMIGGVNKRVCLFSAVGEDFAKSSIKVPDKMEWTGRNFYDQLMKWRKGDITL